MTLFFFMLVIIILLILGEKIAAIAAPMMKKLSLEMGGKNAAIIFDDAKLDKVIPTMLRSCFLNQGEICLCTSRYVGVNHKLR